ncbi:Free methionine-R-sulfoxide reductase [Alloiococcus otitis]|uniref:GAF domain-containing protein n=1 Tax=Alloiococcus otitis ATCC 51267 TaxID=883081 RepID=K9ETZ2_9LACT|nr:GAF domain-containing protein [Alloiococcus otitis]EKU94407.1 hypothetical protein HMPREF9698_00135 [Alloiococcus otitis ATCC 51267]SUU81263.1 Free methionine-R-sulfoxide reductase [Alloiococcus otitis]
MSDPKSILKKLQDLIRGESDFVSILSNTSALLYQDLPNVNWLGFYLWQEDEQELLVGPFQGKVACYRIKTKQGVCGTAFSRKTSIRVANVHQFPGHIACDPDSKSELVVPLTRKGEVIGVIDIDSAQVNRFSQEDQELVEACAKILDPYL